MRREKIRAADLGVLRLTSVFAALAIAVTLALAAAPLRSYFTEWRAAQRAYNRAARAAKLPEVPIAIRQIWRPELEVVDRCGSCHLAADGAAAIPGSKLYAAHPAVAHDPQKLGCTTCHGGQGRATTRAGAHGEVAHWDEPLLPRGYEEAGCGTCHSGLKVGPAELVEKGRAIFAEVKCAAACHRAGGDGPDLSGAALRGFRSDWHAKHVERSAAAQTGPWSQFQPLADQEVAAVGEFLRAQVGAPRLMQAKALAYRRGCRGCHRIDGVGGDDGPDLSDEGRRRASDLDFARVDGARTLPRWLTQHFLDPSRVVAGSQMPSLGLSRDEAELLTLYVLSLRARDIPEAMAPRDRVRVERLGERDFPSDGRSLFGVFCAACHGPSGGGKKWKLGSNETTLPAIAEPEFLAIADDELLRKSIAGGRPGRRMPAWGGRDGGLRPEEIDAVIGFLRSLEPKAPSAEEVAAAPVDLPRGRALFADRCAPCHGEGGGGSAVAPPLATADNPATHEDSRIYGTLTVGVGGTAMGSFKQLDATSLRSLIATVRALPEVATHRTGWAPAKGDPTRGAASFAKNCARCHGAAGEGGTGPALAGHAFLSSASDGYLVATILRGRGATAMPRFGAAGPDHGKLSPDEVADLVAHLRALDRPPTP